MTTVFDEVLDELADALARTAEEMGALIQEEFPAYREFATPEDEQEWRDGLRSMLALFIELARRGRGLCQAETSAIEQIGERRADQRFPLDAVLGSVRLAMHVSLGVVHRAAEGLKDGDRDDEADKTFEVLSLRMTKFINALSSAIGNGYFRRVEETVRSLERNRARFVDDWLAGAFGSHEEILAAAEPLSLDFSGPLGVMLVPYSDVNHLVVAKATTALSPVVVAPMGSATVPHAVLAVGARTAGEWRSAQLQMASIAREHGVTVLVDGPCAGLGEVPKRYIEASAMLQLIDVAEAHPGALLARDLAPFHLVASGSRTTRAVIEREILEPLLRAPNAEKLLFYLRAIVTHGSAKAAAAACGVDVRTVRTHRREIEVLTDRSFDHAGDALWLGLASLMSAL